MGASLLWSCAGGGADPTDSDSYPGAGGPNSGAAGAPVSGAAGHGGSGGSAKTTSGAAGQPVSGAAGQAGSGNVAPPTTGAAGSDSVAPPTTGAAGSGSATPPTTGVAGSTTVAPPTTGAAGSTTVAPPPTTGAAGSSPVAPPTTGAAGSTTVAPPPTTGAAGSGTVAPPTTGAAGSTTVAPPTTGAAGQAGTAVVTPPPGGTTGTATPPPTTPPPTTPPTTTAGSTIVPLYTSPGDASWNAVIAAKMAHPTVGVVAIVNPNNGPGGAVDSGYSSGIARLMAAGIKVIGYVATGYGGNSATTVKADISRWKQFYPGLSGIFFDEQSNKAEFVPYYRDLSQYAKSQGLSFTVGNPGTDTAESFVGALDMMLIYESAGLPSTSAMGGWHTKYPTSNFGIIPYASSLDPAFVKTARQYVGYVYVQSDNLPNPWDSVPSYFSALLAALE